MSFDKLYYKGQELARDINAGTSTVYYQHIYRSNYEGTRRQHMCFQWGAWCWKQARENPLAAVRFLFNKMLDNNKP